MPFLLCALPPILPIAFGRPGFDVHQWSAHRITQSPQETHRHN
jgi:hypothetical protein